jgi:hypothetical protein
VGTVSNDKMVTKLVLGKTFSHVLHFLTFHFFRCHPIATKTNHATAHFVLISDPACTYDSKQACTLGHVSVRCNAMEPSIPLSLVTPKGVPMDLENGASVNALCALMKLG